MAENLFKIFGEFAENCYSKNEELKVIHEVTPEELHSTLSKYDFKAPVPLRELIEEVLEGMEKWNIQVPHPNYYGLFNPATTKLSILADAIVSLFNPQLGAWSHAPFANEVERHTLGYIGKKIGLKDDTFFGCFTTGGSEANLTATLAALSHHFPSYFKLTADYMPKKYPDTEDPYTLTIQGSRRFIGLKLFMILVEKAFRACITSFHTTEKHMDGLMEELEDLINQ